MYSMVTNIEMIICTIELEFSEGEKLLLLKQFHDSPITGHSGINKTLKKWRNQVKWVCIKEDVKNVIKNYKSCQKNKIINKYFKKPMVITTSSSRKLFFFLTFQKIFLDIVGSLVTTLAENIYILILKDNLTKYSLGVPLPNHKSNTVAEAFVIHFVCVDSIPDTIYQIKTQTS